MNLTFTNRATQCITDVIKLFAENRDAPQSAMELIDDLSSAFSMISDNPALGSSVGFTVFNNARIFHLPRYNGWLLTYIVNSTEIVVVDFCKSWINS